MVRNLSLRHVKKSSHKVKARLSSYLQQYKDGTASIWMLAYQQANYPPYLLARWFVEAIAVLTNVDDNKNNQKKKKKKKASTTITQAMRDPYGVLVSLDQIAPDYHISERHGSFFPKQQQQGEDSKPNPPRTATRLAYEVDQAIKADPMYNVRRKQELFFSGIHAHSFDLYVNLTQEHLVISLFSLPPPPPPPPPLFFFSFLLSNSYHHHHPPPNDNNKQQHYIYIYYNNTTGETRKTQKKYQQHEKTKQQQQYSFLVDIWSSP